MKRRGILLLSCRKSVVLLPLLLGACEGRQSALDPHGPAAEAIAELGWIMFIGGAAIFLLVMALAAWAAFGLKPRPGWLGGNGMIVAGGIVFPVTVLTALLVYILIQGAALTRPHPNSLVVEVIGKMWWWEVHYLGPEGRRIATTANEIHIPIGRPVEVRVSSTDVVHSFWVPNLAGKIDLIPGRVNQLTLQADRPGVFRGQCAEYCGAQHALMAFFVVAEPPAKFRAWLETQGQPANAPYVPFLRQGRDIFVASGCGACHVVRGIETATGEIGPDLTHVGGRLSIGAGVFTRNVGTLAGWIADSQHLKPGNRMPSFKQIAGEDLRALAAYLESLK